MRLAFQDGKVHMPQRYMPNLYVRRVRGIGDITAQQTAGLISSGAKVAGAVESGNLSAEISTGASAAGSAALMFLPAAAAAGPIGLAIGTAVIAISMLSGKIAHLISGCGAVCVKATEIVNQEDQYVQQIGAAYWNTPVRVKSFQTWTLQQLDAIFAQTEQMLAPLGAVGEKSAKERLTRGYPSPWCANNNLAVGVDNVVTPNATNHLGRCGGWYDVAYDPIANDPDVQPDSAALNSELNAAVSSLSSLPLPVILGGVGILAYVLFAGGDGK